ncbi:DNA polymerase III subunit beta family protein [Phytoactinopolyspora halotolerans]|uniref:MerR family DNA-binding transcriptional regulator n=1 Tax=Phytoactinopolyspora halotolerans TaxID=1981512 RepID=A0A6L9SBP4_9ACTN|nr:MerR family DNA-binding transcriptional regulator [Phytoactinopolyspora halotolerans]NEE02686.1 MerR family DNA-binding transcriptional regulator [Phytoactinopolyspora halotolerans]
MNDDELRGIGDMARVSGLSVSALRFYDRAGVLVPAAVDPATGYRRYAAGQVRLARLVAGMRRVGMPLDEIVTVLDEHAGGSAAGDILDVHLRRLEDGLKDARREVQRLRGLLADGQPTSATWPVATASADLDPSDFVRAVDGVRFAVSDDPAWPALCGVFVEVRESCLRLVATDRYRLAVCDVPARVRTGGPASVVAPVAVLDHARMLLDHDDGEATVDLEGDQITITATAGQISGCDVKGEFPDHRRLLQQRVAGSRHLVDAGQLKERLAEGPTKEMYREQDGMMTDVVVLVARPGGEIAVANGDEAPGPGSVAVNRAFLLDALDAPGAEQLEFELGGPTSALAISVPDNEHFVSLLMPVRL